MAADDSAYLQALPLAELEAEHKARGDVKHHLILAIVDRSVQLAWGDAEKPAFIAPVDYQIPVIPRLTVAEVLATRKDE